MTQKTRAAITTEISTSFPDNTSKAITPALLRQAVNDINDSANNAYESTSPIFTLMLDAARQAFVPATGNIVYATDTQLFYIGDGATAGGVAPAFYGVATNIPLTREQLIAMGILVPRHRNVLTALRTCISTGTTAAIPKGIFLGNSIVQGTGSTTFNSFEAQTLEHLRDFTNLGAYSDWYSASKNFGVGGTLTSNVATYVGDYLNPSGFWFPKRSTSFGAGYSYAAIMTLRNDANFTAINDFVTVMRATLIQCKRQNLDAFVLTDPPKTSSGVIQDTLTTWEPWAESARQLAADEGASLVDTWKFFQWLQQRGCDLSTFTSDGIHPNDVGHNFIGSLLFMCMTSQAEAPAAGYDRPVYDGRVGLYSNFSSTLRTTQNIVGGSVTLGTFQQTSTARSVQLAEANPQVYVVPTAGIVRFVAPAGTRGVVVTYLDDASNTGTPTVAYNAITVSSGLAINAAFTREHSVYYSFLGLNATFTDVVPTNISITATSGQICVLGVTFVGPFIGEAHSVHPNLAEAGTWSSSTLSSATSGLSITSEPARTSSSVGDTATISWYGTDLTILFAQGQTHGKVTVAADGGSAGTYDLYNAALAEDVYGSAITQNRGLALGWHSTVITVAAANVSSGGNTVKYTGLMTQTRTPDPSVLYVSIAFGETVQLASQWKTAAIDTVISGSPAVKFVPYQGTLSLGGSGSAIVRLQL